MKRILIFTILFPALALVVFLTPWVANYGRIPKSIFEVFPYAYVFAPVPAWMSAGVDWMLEEKPFHIRLGLVLLDHKFRRLFRVRGLMQHWHR